MHPALVQYGEYCTEIRQEEHSGYVFMLVVVVGWLGAKDDKFAVALAMDRSVTAFGGCGGGVFFKHISLLIHMTISRINLLQVVAEKNSFRKPKPFCAIVQLCFDLFLFLCVRWKSPFHDIENSFRY